MAVTATATTASVQDDDDLDEFNPQAKLIKSLEVSNCLIFIFFFFLGNKQKEA